MQDENDTRYVVELQRGELDPNHIIRLVEYWDHERKMRPDYQYKTILIAENTTRYLNVLSLLQETLPLIIIQMVAVNISENEYGIFFTKVLDYIEEDKQFEEIEENVGPEYWHRYSNQEQLKIVNEMLKISTNLGKRENWNAIFALKYTKSRIIVMADGLALFKIRPQKNKIHFWCNIFNSYCKSEAIQQELQNAEVLIEVRGGIDIKPKAIENDITILENIIKECYKDLNK